MTIYVLLTPEIYPVAVNETTGLSTVLFNNGPFYLSTLSVTFTPTVGTSIVLVLGVDYVPILLFNAATAELGVPIYGGIGLVNTALLGTISVQYAPLGLGYSINALQIAAIEANPEIELYTALWENTVPNYITFPKTPLAVNVETQYTISAVNTALTTLTTTIATLPAHNSVFNFNNHIAAIDNPHLDTALEIGLGNIPNWPVGMVTDVVNAIPNKFVTPAAIAGSVNTVAPKASVVLAGVVELNTGASGASDGVDASKVLTSAGLETLLLNGELNVTNLTNNQLEIIQFSPFPIVYPLTFNAVVCNNFSDLVKQVQIATGLSPLMACAKTGSFYFPNRFNVSSIPGL